jgi:hypothetical protein
MIIDNASVTEWSIGIIGVIGAFAGLIKASACREVSLCKFIYCIKDGRPPPPVEIVIEPPTVAEADIEVV